MLLDFFFITNMCISSGELIRIQTYAHKEGENARDVVASFSYLTMLIYSKNRGAFDGLRVKLLVIKLYFSQLQL